MQLWYNVGSRDERTGEYGIAHLIEHMIFKGTEKLSESDINVVTHKLSASCNAFTSYDYTGYLFDTPAQHWQEFFPILADCMQHCSFKPEHLRSELKAVVQELKMYNDDFFSTLVERMMSSIFPDHAYGRPIIGYKQDLWNLSADKLRDFYQRYYAPNNATLVVVGDVNPEEVLVEAEKAFGSIPKREVARPELYHSFDVVGTKTVIHREVQQPLQLFAWVVPGVSTKKEYQLDLLSWILGAGRGCRLYQKLVVELGLATEVQSFVHELFQHGIFFLYVQPVSLDAADEIRRVVKEELIRFVAEGFSDAELERAMRKTEVDLVSLGENDHKVASLLGKLYSATRDENYLATYLKHDRNALKNEIQQIAARSFVPSMMHEGMVVPMEKTDAAAWLEQQQASDAEDARILGGIERQAPVEEPCYALSVEPKDIKSFDFPIAQTFSLSNGIKVFAYQRSDIGKLDVILDLKSKHYADGEEYQGLSMMVADLLEEGTKRHTGSEIAQILESMGMEFNAFPGQFAFSMLSRDITRGCEIFSELLFEPAFNEESIERVREQMLSQLHLFWDTPSEFVGQVAREQIYKNHPYGRNSMGTVESVSQFNRDQIVESYTRIMSPDGARIAVVGDFSSVDLPGLLEKTFGTWSGPSVTDMVFPEIAPSQEHVCRITMARDQYVLAYAGTSVARKDPRFDALLLFDQILSGGVLGSMSSRLFDLREASGLFYSIGGSLLAGAAKEPGMIFIKSFISGDRLSEAEERIEALLAEGATDCTEQELEEARRAIVNSYVDNFASQKQTAVTFLLLDYYDFPQDYYKQRAAQLQQVTVDDVRSAVSSVLSPDRLMRIEIGRF